jgi:hypothetical protein
MIVYNSSSLCITCAICFISKGKRAYVTNIGVKSNWGFSYLVGLIVYIQIGRFNIFILGIFLN